MRPGDLVRLRNMRVYSADGRSTFEYVPDRERSAAYKKVFVCLLLGIEPFQLVDKNGKPKLKAMEPVKELNRLGWLSERQLIKAGVSPETIEAAFNMTNIEE